VINFKKLVMAFISKNTIVGQTPVQNSQEQSQQPNVELELSEIEFLLKVLKDTDLKGYQVEMFYNMIVKLQTLYLKKSGRQ
jgi:hypothetical protein